MTFRRRSRPPTWLSFAGVLVASLGGTGGGYVRASIMVALDLPELVKQADHIAVVEVVAVRAAWDDQHERIYSTIDLKVVEAWKSAAPGTSPAPDHLTVVQAGGTVGDVSMTVFGQGTFVAGEHSLVFLRGPANRAQVVGMTQGKRPLRYEASSRRWLVAPPDLRQTKLISPPAATTPQRPTLPTTPRPAPAGGTVSPAPPAALAPPARTFPAAPRRETALDDLRVEVRRLIGVGRQ